MILKKNIFWKLARDNYLFYWNPTLIKLWAEKNIYAVFFLTKTYIKLVLGAMGSYQFLGPINALR